MSEERDSVAQQPERLSLSRWSRRKLEAARGETLPPHEAGPAPVATAQAPAAQTPPAGGGMPQGAAAPLPPIESLTIDSEFAAFFKPEVPEATKRAALKQLFRDPRFNVMDGLDVYIDDYTQPDPIPAEMMKQLLHTRHIFNPPKTQVNAEGHVVDVVEQVEPQEAAAATAAIAASDGSGDVSPEALPRPADESAGQDKIAQTGPAGGTRS